MPEQRLTAAEARELLPLYVAGGLTPEQRREMESLLRSDPNLSADLRFWRNVSQITHERAKSESGGHIDAETLVMFAEDTTALNDDQRAALEDHLRTCSDCRNELAMLQRSMGPHSSSSVWRFAAAAVILLAILGTLLAVRVGMEPTPPDARIVSAKVPYLESYRSPTGEDVAAAQVDIFPATDSVILHVEVPLPYSQMQTLRWLIQSPGQQWNNLGWQPAGKVDSSGYAIVWLAIGSGVFPESGRYRLKAMSPADGEFLYEIEVVRH